VNAARAQRSAIENRYGRDPDGQSHGELFLSLLASRLTPGGLYLLDEPEAPLSPRGVLQLIALLQDRVARECQFIVATHSPMLLALPEADIFVFDAGSIHSTSYADVDHVYLMRAFLQEPFRFLRHFSKPRSGQP
jgi:predicted ATPase